MINKTIPKFNWDIRDNFAGIKFGAAFVGDREDHSLNINHSKEVGYMWIIMRGWIGGTVIIRSTDIGEGLSYKTAEEAQIACENYFLKHIAPHEPPAAVDGATDRG